MRLIFILFLLVSVLAPPIASATSINGRLLDEKGKDIDFSEFVIWVEGGEKFASKSKSKPKTQSMDMVKEKFTPRTIAIRRNTPVKFENLDKIFHNVFSLDDANTFDLGLFKGPVAFTDEKKRKAKAKSPVQAFPNSGKVNVYCNIHSNMHGIVHVFDHPYFTMANKEGTFHLELPNKPGKYKIRIDSRKLAEPVEKVVEVKGEDLVPVEWSLKLLKWSKSNTHTRKDGSEYRERSY